MIKILNSGNHPSAETYQRTEREANKMQISDCGHASSGQSRLPTGEKTVRFFPPFFLPLATIFHSLLQTIPRVPKWHTLKAYGLNYIILRTPTDCYQGS